MARVGDRERPGAGPVDDQRLLVDELVEALGGGEALVDAARQRAERANGLRGHQQRGDEAHEVADRRDAAGDAPVGEAR